MIDLQIPAEYRFQLEAIEIRQVSAFRVEGSSKQHSPNTWSGGVSQDYTLHFVIEFDQPIQTFSQMRAWACASRVIIAKGISVCQCLTLLESASV